MPYRIASFTMPGMRARACVCKQAAPPLIDRAQPKKGANNLPKSMAVHRPQPKTARLPLYTRSKRQAQKENIRFVRSKYMRGLGAAILRQKKRKYWIHAASQLKMFPLFRIHAYE